MIFINYKKLFDLEEILKKYCEKSYLSYIFAFIPMLSIYMIFLINVFGDMSSGKLYFFSFLLTILVSYIGILFSFMVNVLLFKIARKKISFWGLYPFTFDGKFSFKPLSLFKSRLLYMSDLSLNINLTSYKNDIKILESYKRNITTWLCSETIATIIVGCILSITFDKIFIAAMLVKYICYILMNCIKGYNNYTGYLYPLIDRSVLKQYILVNTPISYITFEQYEIVFSETLQKKQEKDFHYFKLIISYIYSIPSLPKLLNSNLLELMLRYSSDDTTMDIFYKIHCLRLLAVVSRMANIDEYKKIAISELKNHVLQFKQFNYEYGFDITNKGIKLHETFIHAMEHDGIEQIKKRDLLLGVYNMYSSSNAAEKQLMEFLNII